MEQEDIPIEYFLFKEGKVPYLSVKSIEDYLRDMEYYLTDEGFQNVLLHIHPDSIEVDEQKYFREFLLKFIPVIKIGIAELKRFKGDNYSLNESEYRDVVKRYSKIENPLNEEPTDFLSEDLL